MFYFRFKVSFETSGRNIFGKMLKWTSDDLFPFGKSLSECPDGFFRLENVQPNAPTTFFRLENPCPNGATPLFRLENASPNAPTPFSIWKMCLRTSFLRFSILTKADFSLRGVDKKHSRLTSMGFYRLRFYFLKSDFASIFFLICSAKRQKKSESL